MTTLTATRPVDAAADLIHDYAAQAVSGELQDADWAWFPINVALRSLDLATMTRLTRDLVGKSHGDWTPQGCTDAIVAKLAKMVKKADSRLARGEGFA